MIRRRKMMRQQQRRQQRIAAAVLATIAGVGVTRAFAADVVFSDHFSNGSVTDSDTQPGFWTPPTSGGLTPATDPAAGPLQLAAGGSTSPPGQIVSGVQPMFNFFHTPLVIQA